MDKKIVKLVEMEPKDLFLERLNLLIEEIEQWEIEEDDISSLAIFHNLVQARALYKSMWVDEE